MNIEFNILKLKQDSITYKRWSKLAHMTKYLNSEFIVVGEEQISDKDYFIKIIPLEDNKICLVDGLSLQENSFAVPEKDIKFTSISAEYDIPKRYLSLDMVEKIEEINDRLF